MFASAVLEIQALVEIAAFAIVVALIARDPMERFIRPLERFASSVARRRLLCCIAIASLVLLTRVALLSIWSIPRPQIHDEFAYLFGGETLALGRLTNPVPKRWQFFEAPHILVTPSFQGRYPPGQAVALAAGKAMLGHPWFGVLLSCATMSGAICWMLQGWMPARWALLGGLLSLVRLAVCSYWMNSYWGGAVAAIGGCLVMGAYPRIVRQKRFHCAWAMAAGLIILANTRPLEGAISSLPVGVALLYWFFSGRSAAPLRMRLVGVGAPIVLCLAIGAVFTGYYNYRVTGHALGMPHREFARQYAHVPMLLTGSVDDRKVVYAKTDMEYQFAVWEPATVKRTQVHYLETRWYYLAVGDRETLGILLAIPLAMIPLTLRDARIRVMMVCLLMMLLVMLVDGSGSLHYTGPQMGSLFGLLVQCIRHLRAASTVRRRSTGRFLSRVLPIASIICFVAFGVSRGRETGWTETRTPIQHRPEMEATLAAESQGKAIVFVQYRFNPAVIFPFEDWNYNSPDLDGTPVLWVHDMGRAENQKLLQEYPGRAAWNCFIDYSNGPITQPPEISPF